MRDPVTLAFDPPPRVIALGEGAVVVKASVRIDEEAGATTPSGMSLRLTDERGAALGVATTDAKGKARFSVPPGLLGGPGPGEMRLTFDGDARRARAALVTACERRVAVSVTPHEAATKGSTTGAAAGTPRVIVDDGTAVAEVDVKDGTGGDVPSGSVEASVEGAAVGVAAVTKGRARLAFLWPEGVEAAQAHVEVRYVPDVTWYVPGRATSMGVTVSRMGWVRRGGMLLAALGLVGWAAMARTARFIPASRKANGGDGAEAAVPEPSPSLEVLEAAEASDGEPRGWTGRVIDAHDGTAVANARVTLERNAFGRTDVVAWTTSDARGEFRLPPTTTSPTDTIAAQGPLHGRFEQRVPPRGALAISLVSRRRALLRRFVEWARGRGSPFDARPEPTPGHVRKVASDDPRTVEFARAVEDAAFGPDDVDAAREADVERLREEAPPTATVR